MSEKRPPEGARWPIPNWDPSAASDDDSVRPYLDRVAYLEAELAKGGERDPGQKARDEGELKQAQATARLAAIKVLAIKLDAAARRIPAARVEDIDAKFDTLESLLREAGRLRIEAAGQGRPLYLVLARAARDAEPVLMGDLEAVRGHFLRWHGQAQAPEAAVPLQLPGAGTLVATILGFVREALGASKAHLQATAHLLAYFGKDFKKEAREHARRPFAVRAAVTAIVVGLVGALFYQGIESTADPYDDTLGFFGRFLYNVAKLPAAIPSADTTPLIGQVTGEAYVNRIVNSGSQSSIEVALRSHFMAQRTALVQVQRQASTAQLEAGMAEVKRATFDTLRKNVDLPMIKQARDINDALKSRMPEGSSALSEREMLAMEGVFAKKMWAKFSLRQSLTAEQGLDAFDEALDESEQVLGRSLRSVPLGVAVLRLRGDLQQAGRLDMVTLSANAADNFPRPPTALQNPP